jgi:predicted NAD-dependent protein-ADP-ribosyltransferase YbiA (DUF1768 family)
MATEKKTGSIVPARKEMLMIGGVPQDAVFFRHPGEPGGWMSNWFLSPFTLDGTDFSSMEQYIMVRKCMLFGDEALAAAVLRETTTIGVRRVDCARYEMRREIRVEGGVRVKRSAGYGAEKAKPEFEDRARAARG